MKTLVQFVVYMLIAIVTIVLAVILGDYASWYFAWLVGTMMIVLVAAAGGAFMDAQEEHGDDKPGH